MEMVFMYGDGIHLTVAHKREWSYGFKLDNKTVPLPCYPESPYDHQRESSTSQTQPAREGANKSYGTRAFTGNPLILND